MTTVVNPRVVILTRVPRVGEVVEGHTVTEVRGLRIFGMKGSHAYVPAPATEGGFKFRPGYHFATIGEER